MTGSYVRLLGQLALVDPSGTTRVGGSNQALLLIRLALSDGRPLHADVLLEEVWGGDARKPVIHTAISRLRKLIPDACGLTIDTESDFYTLRSDGEYISDVSYRSARFAEALAHLDQGRIAESEEILRSLVAEWATPFGGFNGHPSLTIEGQRIEEEFERVVDVLTELWIESGRAPDEITSIRAWVDADPYRETRWAQLARAYYQGGRQAEALAALRGARELLAEIGLEPGPELVALEDRILNHQVRIPMAARRGERSPGDGESNAPVSTGEATDLFGREGDIADIRERFRVSRLVILLGVPGVGRSRLAAAVALDVPDEVRTVRLIDFQFVDGRDHAVEQIAGAVDAPRVGSALELEAVASAIGDQALLLVLDNAADENLEIDGVLSALLADCPNLRVLLVGSARSASMPSADVVSVDPLDARLPDGRPGPAVELFLHRADLADVSDDTLDAIAELCDRLGGIPAAIEVAAARNYVVTPRQQIADLGPAGGGGSTVEEIIRVAIDALPPQERATLIGLAPFRVGATVEDISSVFDGGESPTPAPTLTLVKRLERLSLVRATRAAGAPRWVVRAAARRLIRREMPREERRRGCEAHLRRQIEMWSRGRKPLLAGEPTALTRLEAGLPELRGALETSIEFDAIEAGAILAAAAEPYWAQHGFIDEGLRWMTALGVGSDDEPQIGPLLLASARLAALAGALPTALERFDRAEQVMMETGDRALPLLRFERGRARTAGVFRGALDHDEIEVAVADHMAAVDALTPPAGERPAPREALALASILAFVVFTDLLRDEDPTRPLEQARSLAIVLEAPRIEAWVDAMDAFAHYRREDYEGATKLLERSISVLSTSADRWNEIIVITLMAANESQQGHHEAALLAARDAVVMQQRWGNREWLTITVAVAWAVTRAALAAEGRSVPPSLVRAERMMDVCVERWDQPARYLDLAVPERAPVEATLESDRVEPKVLELIGTTLAELCDEAIA